MLGATGEFRCLDDASGRVIWRTNILEDAGAKNLQWGMAVSPLVVDDTVIVLPGGAGGMSLVAYDRRTGKRAWSALDEPQAYSSPMLVTLAGRPASCSSSAPSRLMGLSDHGAVLWEYPWVTRLRGQRVAAARRRRATACSSRPATARARPSSRSERHRAGLEVHEVWRNIRMKNQFTSSVLHDGYIYGLDEAILACLDAATGELKWKGGRYGYGQVMLASGHLIVLTEDGDLALVRATPQGHQELARFPRSTARRGTIRR